MRVKKVGADFILTGTGTILNEHVIILNDASEVLEILPASVVDRSDVEFYTGWIIPGFINTHCHLELSHMEGVLPSGTGLVPFIKGIVTQRAADPDFIQDAVKKADHAMWEAGIAGVGDICNTLDSVQVKSRSKIDYYSFVEAFDLMQPGDTQASFDQAMTVYQSISGKKSLVPHAPYSCTPKLLEKINEVNKGQLNTVSIHNQETEEENDFFISKRGALIDFYTSFGLSLSHFDPLNKSSIHYLLNHIDPDHRYLLVHNTMTNSEDYEAAYKMLSELYWTTCANANLYIESRLPNYQMFANVDANMTIGTDSLASNWQLSVWEELLTIKRLHSYLSNETLFKWACINGARALNMQDKLGSIEVGKTPGLLHLETDLPLDQLIQGDIQPRRIV